MRRVCSLLLLLIISLFATAQSTNNLTYSFFTGYGYVAGTNEFLQGHNIDKTPITSIKHISFEVCKDVDGSKLWHNLYRELYYGVGLFYGVFNYSKNLNNPLGMYAILGFTPIATKYFQFKTNLALGVSGIWDGYSEKNKYNIAVSTPIECYVHARLSWIYNITENWHLGVNGTFIHFSNGCIKRPNKGINILTPTVSVSYNPNKIVRPRGYNQINFVRHSHNMVNIYGGVKGTLFDRIKSINNDTYDTIHQTVRQTKGIFGIQYRNMYAFTLSHSLGLGFDMTYNDAIHRTKDRGYKEPIDNSGFRFSRILLSVFLSYEYSIHNFSFIIEPIIYLNKSKDAYFQKSAQRLGFRYQFYKGWFFQTSLRAYQFTKADYIESGIGYRL